MTTVATSSSSGDIHTLEELLNEKQSEYLAAVGEYSALSQDNAENEAIHENVDTFVDHKLRFVVGLMEQLKIFQPGVTVPEDLLKNIMKGQSEELRNLKECLKDSQAKIAKAERELASMENQLKTITAATEKRATAGDMLDLPTLREKARKLDTIFTEHKKGLKDLIADIFPGKKQLVQNLLGDLCEKLFNSEEGGDRYIQIDENDDLSVIEILVKGNIVVRHPHDITRIKLADM